MRRSLKFKKRKKIVLTTESRYRYCIRPRTSLRPCQFRHRHYNFGRPSGTSWLLESPSCFVSNYVTYAPSAPSTIILKVPEKRILPKLYMYFVLMSNVPVRNRYAAGHFQESQTLSVSNTQEMCSLSSSIKILFDRFQAIRKKKEKERSVSKNCDCRRNRIF